MDEVAISSLEPADLADDLRALAAPSLSPIFWRAERIAASSAWHKHIPFGHWVVCAARPRVLVELGTHAGVSYTAFCQAVAKCGLETRCYAVDTWRGDKQAGWYDEGVFEEFSRFHDERYSAFSTPLRTTFDEALAHFSDDTVDLLHIDGLHTYEAARQDFENWRPKLSQRAVVLLHDTNERRGDFGVWRLWAELSGQYPHFEFLHGHGLGVLAVGRAVEPAILKLCHLSEPSWVAAVRNRFAVLGERCLSQTREELLAQELGQRAVQAEQALSRAEQADQHRQEAEAKAEQAQQATALAEQARREAEATAERAQQAAALAEQARREAEATAERAQQATALAEQARRETEATAEQARQAMALADQARRGAEAGAKAWEDRASESERACAQLAHEIEAARRDADNANRRREQGEAETHAALTRAGQAEAEAVQARLERDAAVRERDALLLSTAWQVSWPLRIAAQSLPPAVRRTLRRGVKLIWWSLTLQLGRKLRQRRSAKAGAGSPLGKPGRWSHQMRRHIKLILSSVFFDVEWYRSQNPELRGNARRLAEHYLLIGGFAGRDPSPLFDSDWYFEQNPDVRMASINPLVHYLLYGSDKGRDPRPIPDQIYPVAVQDPPGQDSAGITQGGSRIRMIAVSHNLNFEGAPNSQLEVVVGLHQRGTIEPIVLSPHDGPLRLRYEAAGIPTLLVSPPDLSDAISFERAASAMACAFRESGAEVVYANTLQAFWAIAVAGRAGLPAIWNVRESEPWESYFDFLRPELRTVAYRAFEHAYRVVFVANATREAWAPLNSRDNFTTIYNGLDTAGLRRRVWCQDRRSARDRLGLAENEIAVVLLGTVCERKGQLDLVRAFAILSEELVPRLRVLIVGDRDSPYSRQLHEEAAALPSGRAERMVIIPETDEPYIYLNAADLAVCCSRIESYPRVTLEAMAFGLPIVTTPVFGIAEQVQRDVNALFYDPGDVCELAKHVTRMISDVDLRSQMASNSRSVLSGLQGYESMLNEYGRLFAEALHPEESSSAEIQVEATA